MEPTFRRWSASALISAILILACGAGYAENIDPRDEGSRYAYGENVGWSNAEPLGEGGPGMEVGDAGILGYIWAENVGWINLSCENRGTCDKVRYGVLNSTGGRLSGYAWAENVGWISFSCLNTGDCDGSGNYGVTIDPATGALLGRAWGENIGWITFHGRAPTPYGVATDWGVPLMVPASQEFYVYPPTQNPFEHSVAARCRPLGVGDLTGGKVDLRVALRAVAAKVDLYLAIGFDSNAFLIVDGNRFEPLGAPLRPWKANVESALDESLFGEIDLSLLPSGRFILFVVLTPAGDLTRYYFWFTYFDVP